MEIGATGVSNLAPERPAQSAKPAAAGNGSGPGAVGGDKEGKSLAEQVGAVQKSPASAGPDDKPRNRVDLTV